MSWSDGEAPQLSFAKREAMAEAHNAKLEKQLRQQHQRKGAGGAATRPKAGAPDDDDDDDDGDDDDDVGAGPLPPPLRPPLDEGPVGDAPPPLETPTPSLDRPADQPQMRY